MRILVILFSAILLTSCLKDLRPRDLRSEEVYTPEKREKGIQVLEQYAKVSGQRHWNNILAYELYMNDNFYGWLGGLAQPFKNKRNQFKLDFYAQEPSGTLLFLNGKKKGQVWGYNEGNTYIRETVNGPIEDVENKDIKFWIPTYKYFIEFPFKILEADQIYHVGEEKYGLAMYDLVLVSWKTVEPQKKLDQYLLWVNQSTGLVDKMQYTIREQSGFLKGTAIISEHTLYDGILVPGLIKVYARESARKPLHIMRPHNLRVTGKL